MALVDLENVTVKYPERKQAVLQGVTLHL